MDRLVVHLEHLAEAAVLLRARGVVRERMALVAADQLAEVLLQDHLEETLVMSEQMGPLSPQRWHLGQRRQLSRDFAARVELARAHPIAWATPEPWLDARDASVFRVAHAYRNALYHGDRHNTKLGRPLTVEYLQAVGRTLVRSCSPGVTIGGVPAHDARLRALRRLGAQMARSPFQPKRVASECVAHLVGHFRVQQKSLCAQLVLDLQHRASHIQATLDDLGLRGVTRPMQRDLLRAALLWAAYRADSELVRLQDAQAAIIPGARDRNEVLNDDDVDAYAANEIAIQQRRDALAAQFHPPVTIATARGMARSAERLTSAPDTATLLERYRVLDERLRLLEQAVTYVDVEIERMAEREYDLARGK